MENDIVLAFGKKITQLRNNLSISQSELAERCEMDRAFISNIERGLKVPSLISIAKLAKGLNISIKELFD